jgi:hypothetical protein
VEHELHPATAVGFGVEHLELDRGELVDFLGLGGVCVAYGPSGGMVSAKGPVLEMPETPLPL